MIQQISLKKKLIQLVVLTLTMTFVQGCGEQNDERLREKAALEAEEASKKDIEAQKTLANEQLKAENDNITKWSQELEADLAKRQHFFKALNGTYAGTLSSNSNEYKMKMTLTPSIPHYNSGRVRTLDEVSFDLLNLYFNVQVLSWRESNPLSAVGCRFEEIRPDIENGRIHLTSEDCPNFYSINIYKLEEGIEEVSSMIDRAMDGTSRDIAKKILEEEISSVEHLVGEMQPTSNSNTYEFKLARELR